MAATSIGDGVNVAARLESLCEPGGIFISRGANDQIQDKLAIAFADLGEKTLKNIARPIGVFGLGASDIAALPDEAVLRATSSVGEADTNAHPARRCSRSGFVGRPMAPGLRGQRSAADQPWSRQATG